MRAGASFAAKERRSRRPWKTVQTPVTAVTESVSSIGETPVVDMVRGAAVNSLSGAGRHEAAVERGSRSSPRLCRDCQ